MSPHSHLEDAATTDGIPVSPSLGPTLAQMAAPPRATSTGLHTVYLSALGIVLGLLGGLLAQAFIKLIAFIANLCFFGRWSFAPADMGAQHLGAWVILVPVAGGLIVGLIARYGSHQVRGHGIPEAMETVLTNRSRIHPRLTILKPLSSAIVIGTGGPFGAEGPIIASGGAIGSLLGQILPSTVQERKTLLACGAAGGLAGVFGVPIAAVLMAIELLLFEFAPRSLIPVALASAAAVGVRVLFAGWGPIFPMPQVMAPTSGALVWYTLIGAVVGMAAAGVSQGVYLVEEWFELIPTHWMWYPAIGALAVGVAGWLLPAVLGPGYGSIQGLLTGEFALKFVLVLTLIKLLAWTIALASGTAGGTLAPLFIIGAGLGVGLGAAINALVPGAAAGTIPGVDFRMAALVGMAAMFAGTSRAMLTSVAIALETTHQPVVLVPALAGCAAAYLCSCLLLQHSLMTEKMARRGIRVPTEYQADPLDQIWVRDVASDRPVTLPAKQKLEAARRLLRSGDPHYGHQGFPVVDARGVVVGVLTRRDLLAVPAEGGGNREGAQPAESAEGEAATVGGLIHRPPVIVFEDCTVREAVQHMLNHDVGRLPVVGRQEMRLVGMITRSDVLTAYRRKV